MAIAYKSAGAGASSETSGAAVSPASPATVDAGDILIIHAYFEGTATAPSTPSGFTLLHGPEIIETTIGRHWIYGKIADGSEDGAANALGTQAVTTMRSGRCYSFSGRTWGTITELVRGFAATSHATDPQMPTVTTTINGALAVACVAQNDNNTAGSATGESGGDWTEAVAEYTAALTPGLMLQLQTCTPTADPGTVSGGSVATTNDPCGVIGFEIRPSAPATFPQIMTTPAQGYEADATLKSIKAAPRFARIGYIEPPPALSNPVVPVRRGQWIGDALVQPTEQPSIPFPYWQEQSTPALARIATPRISADAPREARGGFTSYPFHARTPQLVAFLRASIPPVTSPSIERPTLHRLLTPAPDPVAPSTPVVPPTVVRFDSRRPLHVEIVTRSPLQTSQARQHVGIVSTPHVRGAPSEARAPSISFPFAPHTRATVPPLVVQQPKQGEPAIVLGSRSFAFVREDVAPTGQLARLQLVGSPWGVATRVDAVAGYYPLVVGVFETPQPLVTPVYEASIAFIVDGNPSGAIVISSPSSAGVSGTPGRAGVRKLPE